MLDINILKNTVTITKRFFIFISINHSCLPHNFICCENDHHPFLPQTKLLPILYYPCNFLSATVPIIISGRLVGRLKIVLQYNETLQNTTVPTCQSQSARNYYTTRIARNCFNSKITIESGVHSNYPYAPKLFLQNQFSTGSISPALFTFIFNFHLT